MRRGVRNRITGIITAALCALLMTGCAYSSWDEYLEALGIKDPEYEDEGSGTYASFGVTTDETEQEENVSVSEASTVEASLPEEYSVAAASEDASIKADKQFSQYYNDCNNSNIGDKERSDRETIGLTEEAMSRLKAEQEGLYAYDRLTEAGKTLYVEILTILNNEGQNIQVSTTSDDAIELVYDYVLVDHPEIFWVDGYQYTNYTMDDVITKIVFSGNYTYDLDEVARRQSKINDYVNECIANAPSSTDDYYAIKYVYEYIIEHTDYDISVPDNQNICSVFIDGKSVCNGYSKATQYILNKLGIKCTQVIGTVDTKNSKNVRHAWNLVLCNNTYYFVDTTWGDASYQTMNGETADATKLPKVNYDYLNVTTKDLSANHTISDLMAIPVCNSQKDNYYVREDEYFTSAEDLLIKDLFDRRYKDGSDNVTFKCSDRTVYDAIFDKLITQRGVFEYLQGDTSTISYTTFKDTGTIIFWIR